MNSRNSALRICIIALSLAGMLTMAYLVYLHYAPTPEGGSFCNLGEAFSCDVVNKSAYSEVLGIPVAVLGVLYFGIIAFLGAFRYTPATLSFIALFLVVLLGPSLYLSFISKTVLRSICILCEFSKTLMAFIVALILFSQGVRAVGVKKIILALALAVALTSFTYLVHSFTITDPLILPPNPLFSF